MRVKGFMERCKTEAKNVFGPEINSFFCSLIFIDLVCFVF